MEIRKRMEKAGEGLQEKEKEKKDKHEKQRDHLSKLSHQTWLQNLNIKPHKDLANRINQPS